MLVEWLYLIATAYVVDSCMYVSMIDVHAITKREREREKFAQKTETDCIIHYLYANANKSDSITVAIHMFVVITFCCSLLFSIFLLLNLCAS